MSDTAAKPPARDIGLDAARGALMAYIVIIIHGVFWLGVIPTGPGSWLLFEMPPVFIITGVAPGIEASVQRSDGQPTTGLVLASLKLVPVRGEMAALIITGRAGRAFIFSHDDGWAAGGSLGAIVFLSPGVGLEVGYSILWLMPERFCADLVSCRVEGPEIGLRVVF